jgi:hypothetical protein
MEDRDVSNTSPVRYREDVQAADSSASVETISSSDKGDEGDEGDLSGDDGRDASPKGKGRAKGKVFQIVLGVLVLSIS